MKSTDLTLEQLKKLQSSVKPMISYLRKLRARMEATGFPEFDRLLRDAKIAEQVLSDFVSESQTLASYKQKINDAFR